jgi:hypothetical protein
MRYSSSAPLTVPRDAYIGLTI